MPTQAPPSIGSRLRTARQERRLSIEESAWRTRIRPGVLRALERDQFVALDLPGFVRRHLVSYARFLGLEVDEILREFRETYAPDEQHPAVELDRREKHATKARRPKWVVAATISGGILVLAGFIGVLGGGDGSSGLAAGRPDGPRVAGPPAASRAGANHVTLAIAAAGQSHVTVVVDGQPDFAGTLESGDELTFVGKRSIEIVAGNAGAVHLTVNGVERGTPGRPHRVYRATFRPEAPAQR